MSTRKELISNVKTVLEEKGFYKNMDDPFMFDDFFFTAEDINQLEHVKSDEQLKKMLDALNRQDFKKASDAFNYFRKNGLLAVKPALIDDNVPSLLLKWNHYLHWFRGYNFQISDTHSGVGEVYSGADRLDFALSELRPLSAYDLHEQYNELSRFVFVACFIPVLLHLDAGYDLLENQKELLDAFLNKSAKLSRLHNAFTSDFLDRVTVETFKERRSYPYNDSEAQEVAIRILTDDKDYGFLVVSKKRIAFTVRRKDGVYKQYTLKLPESIFLKDDDGDFYITNISCILRIAARALITLAYFHMDYVNVYPIGLGRGSFQTLCYNVPNKASHSEEVEKFIDEFARSLTESCGVSTVIEYKIDPSVAPDYAIHEYYKSAMDGIK